METTNALRFIFVSDIGDSLNFTVNYAMPAVIEEGGKALVDAFVALVLEKQPFAMTLASCKAVDFIKREVTAVVANA